MDQTCGIPICKKQPGACISQNVSFPMYPRAAPGADGAFPGEATVVLLRIVAFILFP